MFPADSANSTTGVTLHSGDERAGVVHGICLLYCDSEVRLAAVDWEPDRRMWFPSGVDRHTKFEKILQVLRDLPAFSLLDRLFSEARSPMAFIQAIDRISGNSA